MKVEYGNVSLTIWSGYAPANHVWQVQNYSQAMQIQIETQLNQAVFNKLELNHGSCSIHKLTTRCSEKLVRTLG